ncbi:unnamed protein product [Owenia fusiformis]|uniref:Uncharacterized protein n=1 Tax=Owenia fusiformis TaxID=6347 RepID=A0A8J1UL94_OWEFU|nr:unnamed protein product [Owenia fusiformis]
MKLFVALACLCMASALPENMLNFNMEIWNDRADMNIVQVAEKLGANTLVKLVKAAGLADTLMGPGPFTVFAPTDDAFAALPKELLRILMKDTALLKSVLLYHVLGGKVTSDMLKNEEVVPSLDTGKSIRINIYNDGKLITATGSPVVMADQMASNGVIHVLSRVMFPIPTMNIVTAVAGGKDFSTLLTAVQTAGLASTLEGGPFTVFAPTNQAFAKLPPGVLDGLLKNKTALTAVLTYHVVSGTFYSASLSDGMMVPTVNGKDVKVSIGGGMVRVNNAEVIMADDAVTNGVIHVIDTVLIPPTMHFQLV